MSKKHPNYRKEISRRKAAFKQLQTNFRGVKKSPRASHAIKQSEDSELRAYERAKQTGWDSLNDPEYYAGQRQIRRLLLANSKIATPEARYAAQMELKRMGIPNAQPPRSKTKKYPPYEQGKRYPKEYLPSKGGPLPAKKQRGRK